MVSPERFESLQLAWVRLLGTYGVGPAQAYPPFDLLVAAYCAVDRYYHNLEHLSEMFRVAGRLASITDDTGPLNLAIWFHDAVYDTRATDNEARSANLAIELLGPIGIPASILDRVSRLVLATAHLVGTHPPGDRDTSILLDADLAILGAAEERYNRYAADIRKEYAWVPDEEFRQARARVLERFLARSRLFWNDLMYQEGEEAARRNIQRELFTLGAPVLNPERPG